ncbi:MAG: hypothetical protein M1814_005178 [Vezdaea aestivalis]|nr:MAG: hypothetical protein M1814_005178 [Vezdaea aestivalis]
MPIIHLPACPSNNESHENFDTNMNENENDIDNDIELVSVRPLPAKEPISSFASTIPIDSALEAAPSRFKIADAGKSLLAAGEEERLWSVPEFEEISKPRKARTRAPRKLAGNTGAIPADGARKKRWSKAMYVDLAFHLQRAFPFADFCNRHSVAAKEVFDVFAAVVHMPLLEQSNEAAGNKGGPDERLKMLRVREKDMRSIHSAEIAMERQLLRSAKTEEQKERSRRK